MWIDRGLLHLHESSCNYLRGTSATCRCILYIIDPDVGRTVKSSVTKIWKSKKSCIFNRKFENYTAAPMSQRSTSTCFFGQLFVFKLSWVLVSVILDVILMFTECEPSLLDTFTVRQIWPCPASYVSAPCFDVFMFHAWKGMKGRPRALTVTDKQCNQHHTSWRLLNTMDQSDVAKVANGPHWAFEGYCMPWLRSLQLPSWVPALHRIKTTCKREWNELWVILLILARLNVAAKRTWYYVCRFFLKAAEVYLSEIWQTFRVVLLSSYCTTSQNYSQGFRFF